MSTMFIFLDTILETILILKSEKIMKITNFLNTLDV